MMRYRSITRHSIAAAVAALLLASCGAKPGAGTASGSVEASSAPLTAASGAAASGAAASGAAASSAPGTASLPAPSAPAMRLTDGYGSARALAGEALNALAARDTARLIGLMITQGEFDRFIYPELGMHYPAARDTSAQAREFVWGNQYFGALKGARRALRDLGGQRLTLRAVTFTGRPERYATYTIHPGTELRVAAADGAETTITQLGSMVEIDGRWKLMSYREKGD